MMITRCRLGVLTYICLLSVDATSCPEAPFEKVECYQDNHEIHKMPLPDYLFNDLDPTTETFSGILADWKNWDIYLPMLACRCARAAKARNATFFGIQSYGKFSSVDFYWFGASFSRRFKSLLKVVIADLEASVLASIATGVASAIWILQIHFFTLINCITSP